VGAVTASLAFFIAFLVDQWAKKAARLHAGGGGLAWGSLVRIRCVANRNHAFARGPRARAALIWCAALVAAIVAFRAGPWLHGRGAVVGLSLAFGGAASNALDILRWRAVVDFIDLGWWPVFNLADVAIVAGLAVAVCA
jgi:signal peptidase II